MKFCGGNCNLNSENTANPEDCSASKTWFKELPPIKNKFKNTYCSLNQQYLKQCDAFVTTSQSAANIITNNFPQLSSHKLKIIEHGRDFDHIKTNNRHHTAINTKIIMFGALNVAKGVDLVIKILRKNFPQKFQLHILGNVSSEYAKPLEQAGAVLHGKYERDNLHAIIQGIAPCLTIIPSIWPETFCHTLTESWACGIPVLASNLGATGDRIETHGGGWILSPESPEQWYEKIISILRNKDDYKTKVDQISRYKFKTTKEMADEYLALYNSIIDPINADEHIPIIEESKNMSHEIITNNIEKAKYFMNMKDWTNSIILLNNMICTSDAKKYSEIYTLLSISYRKAKDLHNARAVISEGLLYFQDDIYVLNEHTLVMEQTGNKKLKGGPLAASIAINNDDESGDDSATTSRDDKIFIVDTANLADLDLIQNKEICVIMPCIDVELGQKAANILLKRAGVQCQIFIVLDTHRQGFIKTVNSVYKNLSCEFVVYLAQDAFPGRNWLAIAYYSLLATNKSLFAFNDGKWDGKLATFGMARCSWLNRIYDNAVFFEGYKSHAADNELSTIARATHTYIYNPNSLLLEVDYDKDAKGYGNLEDKQIFVERCRTGFSGLADKNFVKKIALDYQVFI